MNNLTKLLEKAINISEEIDGDYLPSRIELSLGRNQLKAHKALESKNEHDLEQALSNFVDDFEFISDFFQERSINFDFKNIIEEIKNA